MSAYDPKRTFAAPDCCFAVAPEPHFAGRKSLLFRVKADIGTRDPNATRATAAALTSFTVSSVISTLVGFTSTPIRVAFAYCVGCCWTLMALLLVGGVMNVLWIVLLALLAYLERVTSMGRLIARLAGIFLIAAGAWLVSMGVS
jgi:hypothetical protein